MRGGSAGGGEIDLFGLSTFLCIWWICLDTLHIFSLSNNHIFLFHPFNY